MQFWPKFSTSKKNFVFLVFSNLSKISTCFNGPWRKNQKFRRYRREQAETKFTIVKKKKNHNFLKTNLEMQRKKSSKIWKFIPTRRSVPPPCLYVVPYGPSNKSHILLQLNLVMGRSVSDNFFEAAFRIWKHAKIIEIHQYLLENTKEKQRLVWNNIEH